MCCCGKPIVNGERGYKWNRSDEPEGIYPVNPPTLSDRDELLRDLPGRCGGLDSHSYHYRLIRSGCAYELLVRHGGGDERIHHLSGPIIEPLLQLDSNACYWLLNAIYHAHADGKRLGSETTDRRWREAAAQGRVKTRKVRNRDAVTVTILPMAA
jgi:hypothetical protein